MIAAVQSLCKTLLWRQKKKKCMKDYSKPSLRQNPSLFILHVRTIDLKSEKSSKEIAK